MAKRNERKTASRETGHAVANSDALQGLERQVIAIAEQLGHIAGTAQARADQWLESPRFRAQLTHVRNRASELLGRLGRSGNGKAPAADTRAKSREKVAAAGKKHRQAPARSRGVKHSDEKIVKAQAARRRRGARPRQG